MWVSGFDDPAIRNIDLVAKTADRNELCIGFSNRSAAMLPRLSSPCVMKEARSEENMLTARSRLAADWR